MNSLTHLLYMISLIKNHWRLDEYKRCKMKRNHGAIFFHYPLYSLLSIPLFKSLDFSLVREFLVTHAINFNAAL